MSFNILSFHYFIDFEPYYAIVSSKSILGARQNIPLLSLVNNLEHRCDWELYVVSFLWKISLRGMYTPKMDKISFKLFCYFLQNIKMAISKFLFKKGFYSTFLKIIEFFKMICWANILQFMIKNIKKFGAERAYLPNCFWRYKPNFFAIKVPQMTTWDCWMFRAIVVYIQDSADILTQTMRQWQNLPICRTKNGRFSIKEL